MLLVFNLAGLCLAPPVRTHFVARPIIQISPVNAIRLKARSERVIQRIVRLDNTLPTLLLMSSVEILAPTLQFYEFEYLKGNLGRDVYYFLLFVVHIIGRSDSIAWAWVIVLLGLGVVIILAAIGAGAAVGSAF